MVAPPASPSGRVVFSDDSNKAHLSRLAKVGRATRLSRGIYLQNASLPVERAVFQHLYSIVGQVWPGAVISARSALNGAIPNDGWLFISHPDPLRKSDLALPGVTVSCAIGPGPLPGDTEMPDGLYLAGVARALIENVTRPGRPSRRKLARVAGSERVGDRVDQLAGSRGNGYIRNLLAEVELIASNFDRASVEVVKRHLISVLGTVDDKGIKSQRLSARVAGTPYDAHRLHLFDVLRTTLRNSAPIIRPVLSDHRGLEWLPFFEAYFSNYIEGTVFDVDEAREIVMDGKIPPARPADAHDVTATYRIVSDDTEMRCSPRTYAQFDELLRARHAILMAGRDDKRPGEFKEVANAAGGYRFVEPDLLVGTLREGFARMDELTDPFQRAVFIMFLVTECHPFIDGNGRIARIMANAELVSAGQARIIIPTAYRDNYLSALAGMSNLAGQGESLISALDYPRLWGLTVDWTTWESSIADLKSSNALLEPGIAESTGRRLRLPL